ncbi:DUF2171 domain-containing protein [Deinococcus psychrotolerans]|uniref:DUF2171 domain-containing protein n=1 Tax=Deinococcus psychrotolerans TaxID=2489213 RepID=A0A3G8YFV3_9DEIO|nr:DUF2171 domain-containing protein [Deinococcus psychrotolerans]AZI44182.1 DUF2171 domain-containing protein [Deinococcus psychrotolerans]
MNPVGHIKCGMIVQAGNGDEAVCLGRIAGLKKNFIKLRRRDAPDGKRRYIPRSWVDGVANRQVHLSRTPSTALTGWLTKAELKAWPADRPTRPQARP